MINKQQVFDDSLYKAAMQIHFPLYQYILTHFDNEEWDTNLSSVVVFGDYSLPLAIELSQFRYPVTYLAKTEKDMKDVIRNNERHAGHLIEQAFWFDYTKNVPRAHCIVAVDVLDSMHQLNEIKRYVGMLLRRGSVVLCAVKNNRDWYQELSPYFDVEVKPYSSEERVLLVLKDLRPPSPTTS